jgi:hypothetical protein
VTPFERLPAFPAAADVDVDRVPAGQAPLDQPVLLRWPGFDAALELFLAPLCVRDLPPHPVQGEDQPGLQGAEARQIRRQVVHAFDSRK